MADIMEDENATKDKNMKSWVVSVFLFAVVWSIGATGDTPSYEKFNVFYRDLVGGKMEGRPVPPVLGKIECPMPPEGSVYDYLFEVRMMVSVVLVVTGWVWFRPRGVASGHRGWTCSRTSL